LAAFAPALAAEDVLRVADAFSEAGVLEGAFVMVDLNRPRVRQEKDEAIRLQYVGWRGKFQMVVSTAKPQK
jgi:hypothetical protein